jgi:hypothetical protein
MSVRKSSLQRDRMNRPRPPTQVVMAAGVEVDARAAWIIASPGTCMIGVPTPGSENRYLDRPCHALLACGHKLASGHLFQEGRPVTRSPVLQPSGTARPTLRPKILIGTSLAFIACTAIGGVFLAFGSGSTAPNRTVDTTAPGTAISTPAVIPTRQQAFVADRWYHDTATSTTATRVLGDPPVRDAWERDYRVAAASLARFSTTPRVADRWYEDTPTANDVNSLPDAPKIREPFAPDQSTSVDTPALSQQVSDTWYLDSANDMH